MKNNKNNNNQVETSAISEVLNLDPKTREILQSISEQSVTDIIDTKLMSLKLSDGEG